MAPNIYWASDSTVQDNDIKCYPQAGLAQGLRLYVKEGVEICNHARNGRSSKSFIAEGRFDKIMDNIEKGDFLFIQFGHNDQKDQDPTRYTEPFGEYQENLRMMVNQARSKEAFPVLITSVTRRWFKDETTLEDKILGDYPDAMKAVSKEMDVPLIDLYEKSRALVMKLGKERTESMYLNFKPNVYATQPDGREDNTHLGYEGAIAFAGLIAEELKSIGGIYKDLITDCELVFDNLIMVK